MFRLKIALIVGGAVLAYHGFQERSLNSGAAPQAKTVTCEELAATGPGDNVHVSMTDFLLLGNNFIVKQDEGSGRWDKVWVPAVVPEHYFSELLGAGITPATLAAGAQAPTPKNVKVILVSESIDNETELEALAEASKINGMIVNEIEELDGREAKMLKEAYPGADLDTCWILEHGRKPRGFPHTWGSLLGGAMLSVMGLGWMFGGRSG